MSKEYITLDSIEEDFGLIQSKFEGLRNIPATIVANKYIDEDGLKYFAEKLENKIMGKLSTRPTFEHKCHNCGGTLKMDIENHIFNCPYCDSVYAIGTSNIFDVGGYKYEF